MPAGGAASEEMASEPAPWSPRDVSRSTLVTLAAVAGVAACYLTASSTIRFSTQLICLAVAILFVAVAGVGSATLLADGLRNVRIRRLEVIRLVTLVLEERGPARSDPPSVSDGVPLVSSDKMSRYHRSDCLLVTGKTVYQATREGHVAAGRTGCDICRPDAASVS